MNKELLKFLQESNAIESVYDADSLFSSMCSWEYLIKQKKLTLSNILKTHGILMLNQSLPPRYKGYLRDCNVSVGGRICPSHAKVRGLIEDWIKKYKNSFFFKTEKKIKQAHIEFEEIHPFVDGNGRIGRIIMNWQRVKAKLPILIIHEGEEQQEYYKWFKQL